MYTIIMKLTDIQVNLDVFYIPEHCRSGKSKEGWEKGRVSNIRGENIFVRYWQSNGVLSSQEKLTSCKDLIYAHSPFVMSVPETEKPKIYNKKELVIGDYYITLDKNPGYIFKHNAGNVAYIRTLPVDMYATSGDLITSFNKYRKCTKEEAQWFEDCLNAGKTLIRPKGLVIDLTF